MKNSLKTTLITLFTMLISFQVMVNTGNDVDHEITIIGTDNLQFSETLIEASPGETIRLTLIVESSMPISTMAHNVAILDKDADVQEFVMQSMNATDNEYIAPELEDQVIAYTKMIGGGETSVIEFTVPNEPGDYEYVCTFPGHFFAGMKGILRVR